MSGLRHLAILGVVAVMAASAVTCGDDDESTTGATDSGGALAPPPGRAFGDLATALEAQGLVVTDLPRASLDGAEAGVDITGSKRCGAVFRHGSGGRRLRRRGQEGRRQNDDRRNRRLPGAQ